MARMLRLKAQRTFPATDSERIKHVEVACVGYGRGTDLMLHKYTLALIAFMLVAIPALAIETKLPTAPGPQTAGTPRPPAKVPSTTGAKANAATVAKKPNLNGAAQATTKKAKHAKTAKAKSNIAKSKTPNSKLSGSNHRNPTAMPASSKHERSNEPQSRPAGNRTPTDTTGSVPPRSVPSPGLY
jgi:hypothetical protein